MIMAHESWAEYQSLCRQQTTPAVASERFEWTRFSEVISQPGGQQDLAIVVYGDNSAAVDAAIHFDALILRVGAELWPDADADGDVDHKDFGKLQECIS